MARQRTVNSFQEGMVQDVDKLSQPNSAYRFSKNGKLLFNEDGTYSWENEEGATQSFRINSDTPFDKKRIPLGWAGGANYFILFSKRDDDNSSEIGIVTVDQNGQGTYKSLFNDLSDDPDGDLFNFDNEIKAILLPEIDKLIRVYWVDGVKQNSNRPRAFTFKYNDALPKDDVNAYTAVTQSVHNARLQAEFKIGLVKYVQSVSGGLTSGVYQYAYRLGTADGYRTPFSPLTRSVFLTVDGVDNNNWHNYEMEGVGINTSKGNQIQIKGIDTRYSILEVAYVHAQSEENVTDAAIFVKTEITSSSMTLNHTSNEKTEPIDPILIAQRFSNIKRVKTLNIKDNTMYLGNLFEGDLLIDADTVLSGLQVKPIFKYMRDDEITPRSFEDRPLPSSGTFNAERDYEIPFTHGTLKNGTTSINLHSSAGGTELFQIVNDYTNFKGTQVDHLYKGYRRGETYRFGIVFYDKLGQPGFVYHLADVKFPELYNNVCTAQRVKEDGSVVNVSVGSVDKGYITNDFGNTNGKLPYASSGDFVLDGDSESVEISHLRIMGLEINNIDISSIKSEITGYQIVRAELDETIMYQGIVVPCIWLEEYDGDNTLWNTFSLPTPQQIWRSWAQDTDPDEWSDSGSTTLNDDDLREPRRTNDQYNQIGLFHQNMLDIDGNNTQHRNVNGTFVRNYFPAPYICNAYFPELNFEVEDTILGPSINPNDRLKVVGVYYGDVHPTGEQQSTVPRCSQLYSLYWNFDEFDKTISENNGQVDQHTVQKLYYTNLSDKFKADWNIHLSVGEKTTPIQKHVFTSFYGNEENALSEIDVNLYQHVRFGFSLSGAADKVPFWDQGKKYYGSNINRSIFYKTEAWGDLNKIYATAKIFQAPTRNLKDTVTSFQSYFADYNCFNIINYVRENNSPYGGLTKPSVETTVFESTGHFQPVNNDSFSVPDIVSGIEVFGGDTYIHCIDFVRIMPNFTKWPGQNNPLEEDSFDTVPYPMGQAIVVPLESKINMALRQRASEQNPSFANNGMRTQGAWSGREEWTNDVSYPNGVYFFDSENKLEEEWNYQSALQYTETVQFFAPKPFEAILDDRFPVRWRYSDVKFYGDPIDSFRQYLVNDFRDMDGRYGDIIASEYLFDHIYVLQETAFARLRAYDRALIQSPNLGTLTTGTGERLQGQDYISVKYGSQHQFSVVNSGKSIYWIDSVQRKFCRFAQDGLELLSDTRGMHQFFDRMLTKYVNKDKPINGRGITSGFDYTNNSVYVTFTDITKHDNTDAPLYEPDINNFTTISFNENLNAFISFHSYVPNMYISHRGFIMSIDKDWPAGNTVGDNFYVHENYNRGEFYGNIYDSEIDVVTHEPMMYHKTFDNIRMNINDASAAIFIRLDMFTENQSESLDIRNDDRAVLKENIFRLPLRSTNQIDRMRGKYIRNKFVFQNENNTLVRFTSLETLYRLSNRL